MKGLTRSPAVQRPDSVTGTCIVHDIPYLMQTKLLRILRCTLQLHDRC